MTNDLLAFEIPPLFNPHDRSEILCYLEALVISAFCIAGDDQLGFFELADSDSTSQLKDPQRVYDNSYDELIEIVGGYNFFINENKLSLPMIQLEVDEKKSNYLKDNSMYPIYKIAICSKLA